MEKKGHLLFLVNMKKFSFDIYPVQLLKSLLLTILKTWKSGIYEVSPEDFALCEFVCTSSEFAKDCKRWS